MRHCSLTTISPKAFDGFNEHGENAKSQGYSMPSGMSPFMSFFSHANASVVSVILHAMRYYAHCGRQHFVVSSGLHCRLLTKVTIEPESIILHQLCL